MCIFVASTEFTDYAFVLLDNRDEYLDRATFGAHLWSDGNIYSPEDTSKGDHGTWIGLSKQGRIAVLVNMPDTERDNAPLSRGVLPTRYLEGFPNMNEYIEEHSSETGGFQMLMGEIRITDTGLEPMEIMTYKKQKHTIFEDGNQTIAVSNGAIDDPAWTKVEQAKKLALKARDLHGPELLERLWELLDTASIDESATIEDAKTSIFIPKVKIGDREYGTRTQTIILVDHEGKTQYLEKDVLSGLITAKDWQISTKKNEANATA